MCEYIGDAMANVFAFLKLVNQSLGAAGEVVSHWKYLGQWRMPARLREGCVPWQG